MPECVDVFFQGIPPEGGPPQMGAHFGFHPKRNDEEAIVEEMIAILRGWDLWDMWIYPSRPSIRLEPVPTHRIRRD